jgi:hypothetical protein
MRYFSSSNSKKVNGPLHRLGARKVRLFAVFALAASLGLLLSCNPIANMVDWGGLTIQISASDARLMVPGIDMTVTSYAISGTGPNGGSFSKVTSGASLSVPGLAFGAWAVSVDGMNAAGTIVTHGNATTTIAANTNQVVAVSTAPVAGPGTFSLTVTWPAAGVNIPSVQSQLVPSQGTPINLTFTYPSAGKATYTGNAIQNGYYTLTVKLLDNTQLVMGAVDVVRIVKGQTTSGTINFPQVNTGTGSIQVNITPQMNNPITVTMSGQSAESGTGLPMTVSASVPSGLGNATYVWYLNGVSKTTGSSFTFNDSTNPLAPGIYRLDVTAFVGGGSRAGSATYTFKVFAVDTVTLQWDPSTDPTVTGYKFYVGTTSGVYGAGVDVGNTTTYTVKNLLSGHAYYFAVTDYNAAGQESTYSNEVVYTAP